MQIHAMVNKTSNDIQTICILRNLKITFSIGKYGKVMKRKEEKSEGIVICFKHYSVVCGYL
jgi:hypothetical protein